MPLVSNPAVFRIAILLQSSGIIYLLLATDISRLFNCIINYLIYIISYFVMDMMVINCVVTVIVYVVSYCIFVVVCGCTYMFSSHKKNGYANCWETKLSINQSACMHACSYVFNQLYLHGTVYCISAIHDMPSLL